MLFSVRKIIKRLTENETPGFLVQSLKEPRLARLSVKQ